MAQESRIKWIPVKFHRVFREPDRIALEIVLKKIHEIWVPEIFDNENERMRSFSNAYRYAENVSFFFIDCIYIFFAEKTLDFLLYLLSLLSVAFCANTVSLDRFCRLNGTMVVHILFSFLESSLHELNWQLTRNLPRLHIFIDRVFRFHVLICNVFSNIFKDTLKLALFASRKVFFIKSESSNHHESHINPAKSFPIN